jgi:hypothetical protein
MHKVLKTSKWAKTVRLDPKFFANEYAVFPGERSGAADALIRFQTDPTLPGCRVAEVLEIIVDAQCEVAHCGRYHAIKSIIDQLEVMKRSGKCQ